MFSSKKDEEFQKTVLAKLTAIEEKMNSLSTTTSTTTTTLAPYSPTLTASRAVGGTLLLGPAKPAGGDGAKSAKSVASTILDRYNLPGGVMISLNVRTQAQTATLLKDELEKRGVHCWVCTDLAGGNTYRDEIVRAVKTCRVFLCLINDAWAASGECKDEFSLARRLNLTSHERGVTSADGPRLPVIIPIAFPDLVWDKYEHVELLAANSNFIVCPSETVSESIHPTLSQILASLSPFHVPEHPPPLKEIAAADGSGNGNDNNDNAIEQQKSKSKSKQELLQKNQEGHAAATAVVDTRTFDPYNTPLQTRYLGTISYYQKLDSPTFRMLMYEEMLLNLDFVKVTDSHIQVTANVTFTLLRILIEMNSKMFTLEEMETKPNAAELVKYCRDMVTGTPYGGEEMKGMFDKATGVLSLENVKCIGSACPTWRRLTLCQGGMSLVGVGGNYKKESDPSSGHRTSDETATRLVAF